MMMNNAMNGGKGERTAELERVMIVGYISNYGVIFHPKDPEHGTVAKDGHFVNLRW